MTRLRQFAEAILVHQTTDGVTRTRSRFKGDRQSLVKDAPKVQGRQGTKNPSLAEGSDQ